MNRNNKYLFSHHNILIDFHNERPFYKADPMAIEILEKHLPRWVPERLKKRIVESLIGFDFEMAMAIVANVNCCAEYGLCEFTGLLYIDRLLSHHYNALLHAAEQQGIEIKNPEKENLNNRDW